MSNTDPTLTNLFHQLGQRFQREAELPRSDGTFIKLPMVVLSGREEFEVKQNAHKEVIASFGKNPPKKDDISNYDDLYQDRFAYWTIFYSVRLPTDINKKFFPTIDAVNELPYEHIGVLSNVYLMLKVNQPYIEHLSNDDPDKVNALIDKIIADGKDPHFFLNSLPQLSLIVLINIMGARLARLQTDNGITGTPSENTEE